jgi:hypothetical protein
MNIIFIDFLVGNGHVPFNKNQLGSLLSIPNVNVDLVVREETSESYDNYDVRSIFRIPTHFYKKGRIATRLSLCYVQYYIWRKIDFSKYDYVIISAYDAMTLWTMPRINKPIFLIEHNNVSRYTHTIERWLSKIIPGKITHVVLNEYIKKRMLDLGFKNVEIIQHGYSDGNTNRQLEVTTLRYLSVFSKVIFAPSSTSSDIEFISRLIKSAQFQSYLKEQDILFVVKGNYTSPNSKNVKILNGWITTEEYNYIFEKSALIMLLYNSNFRYRVSGVFFECISKNKKCILNDNPNFRVYEKYINYNAYTSIDVESVLKCIDENLRNTTDDIYVNKSMLLPNWQKLLYKGGESSKVANI